MKQGCSKKGKTKKVEKPKMSSKEFWECLAHLARYRRFILSAGMVRAETAYTCPVVAVARAKGLIVNNGVDDYEAARKLGLHHSVRATIVAAADQQEPTPTRQRLLKVLKLSTET